jgi:hypothetical protein
MYPLPLALVGLQSPLSPWTTALPLLFVLTVNAIKEAVEDVARHKYVCSGCSLVRVCIYN